MKKKAVLFILFFLGCMIYGQEGVKNIKSEKYELKYIEVKKFIDALPEELKKQKINILTDINGFIIRGSQEEQKTVEEYIKILDVEKEEKRCY